jgi:hypothetical protein
VRKADLLVLLVTLLGVMLQFDASEKYKQRAQQCQSGIQSFIAACLLYELKDSHVPSQITSQTSIVQSRSADKTG